MISLWNEHVLTSKHSSCNAVLGSGHWSYLNCLACKKLNYFSVPLGLIVYSKSQQSTVYFNVSFILFLVYIEIDPKNILLTLHTAGKINWALVSFSELNGQQMFIFAVILNLSAQYFNKWGLEIQIRQTVAKSGGK